MSSIPRGPNHDDAAEPPTPGTNLPRPSLDQTLVGVAPSAVTSPPLTPARSPAEESPEAEQPTATEKPRAIVATPMIAVSGDAPAQELAEPARPDGVGTPRAPSRADVDPALQSTALASDYLQAARDAALRKAGVPRPRRQAPALGQPSSVTLHATGDVPAGEPTRASAGSSPAAAPPRSIGTQASVAPPLEAEEAEHEARAPSPPLTYKVDPTNTPAAHGNAPAQPSIRPFEPVPTVRAPLWEQAPPSVGRPLTLDHEVPDWEPLRARPPALDAHTGARSGWYRLRWVALAAAALAAIAFAVFGEQLTRAPEGRVKLAETAARPPTNTQALNAAPPEQTLLANHPASEPITAPAVAHVPVAAPPAAATPDDSVSTPVIAPATAATTSHAVVASKGKKKAVKRAKPKRKRAATPASEPAPADPK